MDNKSYAKCKLCDCKGSCAFNHNGDQELCPLNVTHLDLADHDKKIKNEVIEEFINHLRDTWQNKFTLYELVMFADWMKGEQNE